MLRFKLVEQVLHIMLNQDNPRSCVFFRPQIYVFLHYPILGKKENMGKKLCKRLHSHRLNPLNNARFPMSYAVLNLTGVPTDDIAYIEVSGNSCDVHLFNGESMMMTFQLHYFVEAFNKLKQNFFTRVGKSLIVNTNYVYAIIPAKTNF